MTTVYYLQWHRTEPTADTQASDLFHEFHHDPPEILAESAFDELYAEVVTTETSDLEQLFAEWNRGSGRESDRFLDLRYCERCQTYIEGDGEAVTHAAQNHGYDALTDASDPAYVRGIRSLSVGDIVERDGRYNACAPIGWQEIELIEGDP